MTTGTQATEAPSFFDLHISGIGYLSRFRDISSKSNRRHEPYYAVSVSALEGPTNAPNYAYFDARIAGRKALEALLLPEIAPAINDDDARVLASFKLGGVAPETYQVRRGAHAGETRISLKTRLIKIRWIRIKNQGETEYRLAYQDDGQDGTADTARPTQGQPVDRLRRAA